ncbi:helix-turn-helix domain-containing protein [Frankia sp. Mgl5]|uniref:helix-turn-helix domain-containing protein n=1 Tax=Frankia sp. Mgl5 TaxID=2933793 RepID=UPI00200E6421|nr:helix-turn-helix transcriptional regulator [Frankia sp. Mgl5]MCK9932005.1 helix-turn-helix domain-containing protein [Frankia sp. Mgl5]
MSTNEKQTPESLGRALRKARAARALSIRQLVTKSGVPKTTIARLESDSVEHPLPENLVNLARALEISAGDLFLLAGMPLPEGLPSLPVMLRAEYDLPEAGIREAEASIRAIVAKYEARSASTGTDT